MITPEISSAALVWIIDILRKHAIPFQISGGLAAIAYGSPRSLNDIDIDIPDARIPDIVEDVAGHCPYPLEHYKDADWDLQLMTLDYFGQAIDISGAQGAKVFDKREEHWVAVASDPTTAIELEVLGMRAPVMNPKSFIAYKTHLHRVVDGREIDAEDVRTAEAFLASLG